MTHPAAKPLKNYDVHYVDPISKKNQILKLSGFDFEEALKFTKYPREILSAVDNFKIFYTTKTLHGGFQSSYLVGDVRKDMITTEGLEHKIRAAVNLLRGQPKDKPHIRLQLDDNQTASGFIPIVKETNEYPINLKIETKSWKNP